MRNLLMASAAVLTLAVATPALAQSNSADAAVGGGAGAAAGATAGFFLGGPVGAVIGGFSGAMIGASAAVPDTTVTYVETHPVQPVMLEAPVSVGDRLAENVTIYPVPATPEFGYIYTDGRAYIVRTDTREVVQSPGYVIPRTAVQYAQANPTSSITVSGTVAPGFQIGPDVKLGRVPDSTYSYVYINGQPALIDDTTHVVVWVGQ